MSVALIYFLCALFGFVLGWAVCYVWAIRRISTMHAQITVAEQRADIISAHQELAVQVIPYVRTAKSTSLFSKSTSVEIGYQYQLFIRGLPCFEPHSIVTESAIESEVSDAGLELLRNRATELAQAALLAMPEGRAAKLVSIAATQIIARRR